MRYIVTVVFLGSIGLAGWLGVSALAGERARADRAASAAFVAEARSKGLEVALADTVAALSDLVAEHVTALDSMVALLEASRAKSAALTEVVARASGESKSDTVYVDTVNDLPTRLGFTIVDPPFRSINRCIDILTDPSCITLWSVTARGRLVHTEAADGSLVVMAEASDPRVEFEVERLVWVPQRPALEFPRFGRLAAFTSGATVGAIVSLLLAR